MNLFAENIGHIAARSLNANKCRARATPSSYKINSVFQIKRY